MIPNDIITTALVKYMQATKSKIKDAEERTKEAMLNYKSQIYPFMTNPHGHSWIKDKEGFVDILAYDYDYHHGPRCSICGYGFCMICQKEPDSECSIDV